MNASIARQPTLRVNPGPSPYGPGSITVCCLDPDLVAFLLRSTRADEYLKSLFRVTVAQAPSPEDADLPPVSGRYFLHEDGVRFIPQFPFEKGLAYRLRFDPQCLLALVTLESFSLKFTIPEEKKPGVRPEVMRIFPSSDVLPENLLRFYVCFSNSMQHGRVHKEISLLDSDRRPVADALYRHPVELWDRSMSQLTVLLDPGRLKRWVGPNVELGPPLRVGESYTLEIGSGMIDKDGRLLREPFRKDFVVGDPIREEVSVESWTITAPTTGSREPLVIMFRDPLDWALLLWTISIASADASVIDGEISVDQDEKRWCFIPARPWIGGVHHIHIDPGLEDVCGNNLSGAFDRVLHGEPDEATTTIHSALSFHVT